MASSSKIFALLFIISFLSISAAAATTIPEVDPDNPVTPQFLGFFRFIPKLLPHIPKIIAKARPKIIGRLPLPDLPLPDLPLQPPPVETPVPDLPLQPPPVETPVPDLPLQPPPVETPAVPELPLQPPPVETPAVPDLPLQPPPVETPAVPDLPLPPPPVETPVPDLPLQPPPVETPVPDLPLPPTPVETPVPDLPFQTPPVETPVPDFPLQPPPVEGQLPNNDDLRAMSCPIDTQKLGACMDVIGLRHSAMSKCCPIFDGLVEAEAAVCMCTTLKQKAVNLKVFVPIALQLLANCGKTPPPGYTCSLTL